MALPPMTFDDERPEGAGGSWQPPPPAAGDGAARPFLAVVAIAALVGALFAAVSTGDFISHLDRQVHSVHCSFLPGAGAEIGESGCRTVMMSPYSSLFREHLWGGLPISLLALAVFAYLAMHAGRSFLSTTPFTTSDSAYLIAATLLPVAMSAIYGFIAVSRIGAVCKLCIGIYVASGAALVGALLAHGRAEQPRRFSAWPGGAYARWFGEGVLYVALLAGVYVLFAPASPKSQLGCGTLAKAGDAAIRVPLGTQSAGTPAIAVLDPLCPACRGFDERLRASDLYSKLRMEAVLFPLDSTCNWMVKESLHPGACAVSEAMLCDKPHANQILDWAFANQEELRRTAGVDEGSLRRTIEQRFPGVKGCLGSANIKNQLNRSLRWAVANALPVLTPQLFIADRRVCDEDTDLGLEFTIASMLNGAPARGRP